MVKRIEQRHADRCLRNIRTRRGKHQRQFLFDIDSFLPIQDLARLVWEYTYGFDAIDDEVLVTARTLIRSRPRDFQPIITRVLGLLLETKDGLIASWMKAAYNHRKRSMPLDGNACQRMICLNNNGTCFCGDTLSVAKSVADYNRRRINTRKARRRLL